MMGLIRTRPKIVPDNTGLLQLPIQQGSCDSKHPGTPLKNKTILNMVIFLMVGILGYHLPVWSSPVRIGAIFSQTGIAAVHNEPLISMIQLAVDDINRSGGVLNQPIQLFLMDNQSTPIGSSIAANEAVRLNLTAVIGAHWSSHSLFMAPILQKAGIPMISPGSTNPEVTKTGDYIFRACFIDSFQGLAMARFSYDNLKARSAAVVRNIDEEYSVMLAEFFSKAFSSQGGKILLDTHYRGKAIDFAQIIEVIKKKKPDVVYLPGYTRDSGLFIKQSRQMGMNAVFLGGDAWDEIGTVAGDLISGSYQSAPWHPDVPSKKSAYLKQLFETKFHRPITNMSAPLAYDAVHLMANAIERAGSTDNEKIRDALASTREFDGVTGVISFDSSGDPLNKQVIIVKFEHGKAIYHKTIQPGLLNSQEK